MKHKQRGQRPPARKETIATWVALVLLGLFAGIYLTSLVLIWVRPEEMQPAMLERLLIILVPLVTLAVQWYLRRRDRNRHD